MANRKEQEREATISWSLCISYYRFKWVVTLTTSFFLLFLG